MSRPRPIEYYENVASVYRAAVEQSRSVTDAVAELFDVTPAQARDAIFRARNLGLLSPTVQGKASNPCGECPACGAVRSRWRSDPFDQILVAVDAALRFHILSLACLCVAEVANR